MVFYVLNGNITGTTTTALETALGTALKSGGDFEMTVNGATEANDGWLVLFDNGTNSYLATVETEAIIADDGNPANVTVNVITVFTGIADCTTISASLADIIA